MTRIPQQPPTFCTKRQLSSACSEIVEDLLKTTYDEEDPFDRFASDFSRDFGPNTPFDSLAMEDGGSVSTTWSSRSFCLLPENSDQQVLYRKIGPQVESSSSINSGDREDYLEVLRSDMTRPRKPLNTYFLHAPRMQPGSCSSLQMSSPRLSEETVMDKGPSDTLVNNMTYTPNVLSSGYSACAKMFALILTINTLFLAKYLVYDILYKVVMWK